VHRRCGEITIGPCRAGRASSCTAACTACRHGPFPPRTPKASNDQHLPRMRVPVRLRVLAGWAPRAVGRACLRCKPASCAGSAPGGASVAERASRAGCRAPRRRSAASRESSGCALAVAQRCLLSHATPPACTALAGALGAAGSHVAVPTSWARRAGQSRYRPTRHHAA